jgi:two-component system chemotaxis response regulator CheB
MRREEVENSGMRALPSSIPSQHDEVTGLSCPECFGVLAVHVEGGGTLRFTCRTGHGYSADDVIVGKEHSIEEYLWAAMTAFDELKTLLRELVELGGSSPAYERRIRTIETQLVVLRKVLADDMPTALDAGELEDGST